MFAIKVKRLLLSIIIVGIPFTGQAQEVNQSVPSLHPSKNCLVKGASEIPGMKEYGFLTSDDCSSIFVRPPLINQQYISHWVKGSLELCEAVQLVNQRIVDAERDISALHRQLSKLIVKVPANDYQQAKLEKKIKWTREQIDMISDLKHQYVNNKDKEFGSLPGAGFSITLDSQIREDDRVTIAEKNYYPVNVLENGEILYKRPNVWKAEPSESFYSFFYRTADTRSPHSTVISSHAPLETMDYSNEKMGIVHVYANEGFSAEMTLNLPSICVGAKKDSSGQWVLDPSRETPVFTVNRTYTVDQRIPFSYTAELKQDIISGKILEYVKTVGNDGFSLTQVFRKRFISDLDNYLIFTITDGGSQLGSEKINLLKKQVFVQFLDSYMNRLLELNVLKVVGVKSIGSKDGEFSVKNRNEDKCFQSSFSELCHQKIYAFSSWTGVVSPEIQSQMTSVEGVASSVTTNEMVPVTYTSTFLPKLIEKE